MISVAVYMPPSDRRMWLGELACVPRVGDHVDLAHDPAGVHTYRVIAVYWYLGPAGGHVAVHVAAP
jgi:hypothetical protein